MSRLSMNFTGPEPRRRRGPLLTALARLILFTTFIGALAVLALRVLGARL